jgi:hypothetical protein
MNADELDRAWRGVRTPDTNRALEAVPVSGDEVWAAVDYEGRRHLLLQVPDGTEAPSTTTQGLQVNVARHQVEGRGPAEYLDLRCLSDDVAATFTAVAADIGADASHVPQAERVSAVVSALSRWQWFWGIEPGALSAQDALGLFAELWFLHRWTAGGPTVIDAWTASVGSRHDFQWPDRSVEVKAAARRADGAVLHRVSHLDQLADPEQGQLFLFSLHVVHDQIAHNNLPDLVDRIASALRGAPQARDDFARKLGRRGYSPAHAHRYDTPYRILAERLYKVVPGFPRLTAGSFVGGMPAGVTDVSYVIDLAVCGPWLVASAPDEWRRYSKEGPED